MSGMNVKFARKVGKDIGKVVETERDEKGFIWGKYVRLRVSIDITKPLRRGVLVDMPDGKKAWAPLKYERLPNFCFWCRRLGHGDRDCEDKLQLLEKDGNAKAQYGPWLRASSTSKTEYAAVRGGSYGGGLGNEQSNRGSGRGRDQQISVTGREGGRIGGLSTTGDGKEGENCTHGVSSREVRHQSQAGLAEKRQSVGGGGLENMLLEDSREGSPIKSMEMKNQGVKFGGKDLSYRGLSSSEVGGCSGTNVLLEVGPQIGESMKWLGKRSMGNESLRACDPLGIGPDSLKEVRVQWLPKIFLLGR